MADAPQTGQFEIDLPTGWFRIDLDPATRDASTQALVDVWVERNGELAPYRETLVATLTATAGHAVATHCILAAASFGYEPGRGPSFAGLAVRLLEWPGTADVDDFIAGMARAAEAESAVTGTEPIDIAGRKMLLVRQRVDVGDGEDQAAVTSFVVPMPAQGVFANLEFTSPVAPAPEHAFAHVAATARVVA